MTWEQLRDYIDKSATEFLQSEIKIYDYNDGVEYSADITELLCGKADEKGWIPYLTINHDQNTD